MKTFHPVNLIFRHKCQQCDKDYSRKMDLNIHIKTIHEKIKPERIPCTLCTHIGAKNNMKRHMASVHQGVRHKCDTCDKEFTQKKTLEYHVENVHQGVKHKCDICNSQYTHKATLREHKKLHLKKDLPTLNCDSCSYKTVSKAYLRSHRRYQHAPKSLSFECKICFKIFTSQVSFRMHRKVDQLC